MAVRPPALQPMLLRIAPLPSGEAWSFEPKWDTDPRALAIVDGSDSADESASERLTRLCPAISWLEAGDHPVVAATGWTIEMMSTAARIHLWATE